MNRKQFWLTTAPLAGALLFTPALAQTEMDTMEMLPFDEADADASGGLDESELEAALYTAMDTDGSATVEEQEYARGGPIAMMFDETVIMDADANADAMLDEEEFGSVYDEASVFVTFDTDEDGMISAEEYEAGAAAEE